MVAIAAFDNHLAGVRQVFDNQTFDDQAFDEQAFDFSGVRQQRFQRSRRLGWV
uniref:Uncharacterized protein n=1 Tax=Cucumis melo TaxID=3656 RepID=A0A9I9DIP2_CUCME